MWDRKKFKEIVGKIERSQVEARLRDKGLNSEQTGKLAGLVLIRQTNAHLRNEELIEKMRECPDLVNNEKFKKAIDELKVGIFISSFKIDTFCSFSSSTAICWEWKM